MRVKEIFTAIGRPRAMAALGLAVAVLAAGCGLGGEKPSKSGDGQAATAGSIEPIESLKDLKVVVGSKDFTEQLILGQMSLAVLEAAGAAPVDETNITGSNQTRKALETGEIDTYWEYVGTGWTVHLEKETELKDVDLMARKVADEDLKNDIVWLPTSPLINSYGLAISQEQAKRLKISKMSQLAALPKNELTFCMGTEFYGRAGDGYKPMLKHYGIEPGSVPTSQEHTMQDGLVYGEVAKGDTCNFASVFTTDGRIAGNKLVTLADDKQFWPPYNAAVTIRKDLYDEHPELAKVFNPVSEKLTTQEMQRLTTKVDMEGQGPRKVARDWLKKEGFIGG